MLKHLQIKNFALIDNCEVDFSDKLNMITGETGAGKSILIQALSVLLGGRASTEQIRTGCEEAVLNGVIDIADNQVIQNLLNELGIDSEDGMLIIRRVLSSNGKSRSFMNGTQVTSKELAAVSAELFDFHGQHDGVSLLSPKTHITFLDSYAELDGELAKLKQIYGQMQDKRRDLKKLECDDEDKE
ncbi:MAG: AAA family ATPase, partial [Spirochaetales bacterium]|nr:AAA family ATPase [Spirochaetales bacterium]